MMMSLPFYRTLKQVKEKGFTKTAAILLAIAIEETIIRLKYVPETAVLKVNESMMLLFPKKGDIHTDLFLHKKREPICTEYLLDSGVIKKDDIVLDIGANIGYYALVESQLVGKGGKVYAVEPVYSNYKLLEKNVELNNLENVSTYQFAFGADNTKAGIFVSNKSNLCAMTKEAVGGEILCVQNVVVMTVDEFVKDKKPPTFIRMDVEGYEYEIIKGMSKTLRGKISILLELHPLPSYIKPENLDEMFRILEQNKFRVKFIVYEHKVRENWVSRLMLRSAGDKLPIVGSNLSIQYLRKIVPQHWDLASPNILFEKDA
jgi:FkbM family methyltransferase